MAANWKMHKTKEKAQDTAHNLISLLNKKIPEDREVLIIPPFTALDSVWEVIKNEEQFVLGAQNFFPAHDGAYTGEISPAMLTDQNCIYALVGHSERRHILGEKNDFIAKKVSFGLENGLKIILCIGETLEERKAGKLQEILYQQLEIGLQDISSKGIASRLSIAYEPVWAIGTGEVAGPKEITEAHNLVRKFLQKLFANEGEYIRILYGGSVKPDNCSEIMGLDNVNGVLVGGASLNAETFSKIVLNS